MATRASSQKLSARLNNQAFRDFQRDLVLTNAGVYDPVAESPTAADSQTIKGIRLEYKESQVDGERIKRGDFKIVCVAQELTLDVRPDSTSAVYDGKPIQVIYVSNDTADAAVTFQAREM